VGHGKGSGIRWPRSSSCVWSGASATLVPNSASCSLFSKVHRVGIWLTLPSRGCPKGCAFCAPLMSNVRRRDCIKKKTCVMERLSLTRSPAFVICTEASVANEKQAISSLPSQCHIGIGFGTLPLVNSQSATALAHRGQLPSSLVAPVNAGGESKQMQATIPRFRSVPVGSEANTMVAAQPATPNPSIEGMPKRLRLLCTPHVKRSAS
jgi:hypothetical protein